MESRVINRADYTSYIAESAGNLSSRNIVSEDYVYDNHSEAANLLYNETQYDELNLIYVIDGDVTVYVLPFIASEGGYYGLLWGQLSLTVDTEQWLEFLASIGGGGGLDCEGLRSCLLDNEEYTPLLFGETMPRNEGGQLLFQYTPIEELSEELNLSFEVPFTNLSDIMAVLQVISRQIQELDYRFKNELVGAAFPEWNQYRIENNRPVGLFQACELKENNKLSPAHFQIQIPYLIDDPDLISPMNYWYKAGNIQCRRVFKDNSQIIIYCIDRAEGERVLSYFTSLMIPERAEIYTDRFTEVDSELFREKDKVLKYLSYYPEGHKQAHPKWAKLILDVGNFSPPTT